MKISPLFSVSAFSLLTFVTPEQHAKLKYLYEDTVSLKKRMYVKRQLFTLTFEIYLMMSWLGAVGARRAVYRTSAALAELRIFLSNFQIVACESFHWPLLN